jgi:urease accessory protein
MLEARNLSLIRALQLASGTLPVGAYAYSQGLEWAVEAQWVSNEQTLNSWLCDQLTGTIATSDLPVLLRLHAAARDDDIALMDDWSRVLIASRETSELIADDRARGKALARLLHDLGFEKARRWLDRDDTPFAALASVAAVAWEITYDDLAIAYCWGWLEAQVLAGVKLIPLGQVAGQRLLFELAAQIPQTIAYARELEDAEIGATLPLLALASSLHETQYTRLFRS